VTPRLNDQHLCGSCFVWAKDGQPHLGTRSACLPLLWNLQFCHFRLLLSSIHMGSVAMCSCPLPGHHAAASQSSVTSNRLQLSSPIICSRQPTTTRCLHDHRSRNLVRCNLLTAMMKMSSTICSREQATEFHELFKTISEGDCLIEKVRLPAASDIAWSPTTF
jgi:hypothetical protein